MSAILLTTGDITGLISNVGFPIAMTLVLLWYVYTSNNQHIERIDKLNEEHENEMKGLQSALENNTKAIDRISDLVERMVKGND